MVFVRTHTIVSRETQVKKSARISIFRNKSCSNERTKWKTHSVRQKSEKFAPAMVEHHIQNVQWAFLCYVKHIFLRPSHMFGSLLKGRCTHTFHGMTYWHGEPRVRKSCLKSKHSQKRSFILLTLPFRSRSVLFSGTTISINRQFEASPRMKTSEF